MKPIQSITLYFREGGSDKVYQANLEHVDGGHIVTFAYGRRGSTLQTGTKTLAPVSHEDAQRIYDKLVREKTAKGYQPGGDGARFAAVPSSVLDEDTGIRPHLLNPLDEDQADALVHSADWCAQEKYDGRRLLLRRTGKEVIAINRKGLRVSVPGSFMMSALAIEADYLLDGEAVGEIFQAFDLLEIEGRDLRKAPLHVRLAALENVLHGRKTTSIRLVPTARFRWEKDAMLESLRGEGREGIVFKRLDAPYTAGRPHKGGTQLKLKFVETASFVVTKWNGSRSVALGLFDKGKQVPAGNVTIPPNYHMPPLGCVADVRYLHAFRESGAIYQPVYLGLRDDIDPAECTVEQLKFKPEPVTAA